MNGKIKIHLDELIDISYVQSELKIIRDDMAFVAQKRPFIEVDF